MHKLILIAGVAGSGKSTYIKNHFDLSKYIVISSDEIRVKITGSYKIALSTMQVYDIMIEQTNKHFESNDDVNIILDSTFLTDERRNYFLDRIKNVDYIELILLKLHSLEEILRRNKLRDEEKWVPEEKIKQMYESYKDPTEEYKTRYNKIEVFYDD